MSTDFYTDLSRAAQGPEQDRAARLTVTWQLYQSGAGAQEIHQVMDMLGILPEQEGSRDSARFPFNLTPKEKVCTPKDKNSAFIP